MDKSRNLQFIIDANKLFYYSANYKCKEFQVVRHDGSITPWVLPEFFEAIPDYFREHYAEKWRYALGTQVDLGTFFKFYAQLDGEIRAAVLGWISDNYTIPDNWGLILPE